VRNPVQINEHHVSVSQFKSVQAAARGIGFVAFGKMEKAKTARAAAMAADRRMRRRVI
jgi:hypothetical protein